MTEGNLEEIQQKGNEKMEAAIQHLRKELSSIRTGRASLSLLDGVKVDYYGNPMPLQQIATLSVPEARLITIQPWESNMIVGIEKAIQSSDIGITPTNDGKIIRLNIPPLTEERRKTLVKTAKKLGEDAKIAVRNVRRDSNEEIKKRHKESSLPEDRVRKVQDAIQKMTDQYIKKIDEVLSKKEEEIISV